MNVYNSNIHTNGNKYAMYSKLTNTHIIAYLYVYANMHVAVLIPEWSGKYVTGGKWCASATLFWV